MISLHVHDISHLGKLSKWNEEKFSQEATAFGNHRDGMNSFLETILLKRNNQKTVLAISARCKILGLYLSKQSATF